MCVCGILKGGLLYATHYATYNQQMWMSDLHTLCKCDPGNGQMDEKDYTWERK